MANNVADLNEGECYMQMTKAIKRVTRASGTYLIQKTVVIRLIASIYHLFEQMIKNIMNNSNNINNN